MKTNTMGGDPWALHRGDCLNPVAGLASLPDRSIDVVLTDPPYSEHVHSKGRRVGKGWRTGGGAPLAEERALGFDAITQGQIAALSEQFARLAHRWVLVFSDVESTHLWRDGLEAAGLEYVRTMFWHKLGGAPQFTGDRPAVACEAITVAHPKGRKRWNGGGKQGFYAVPIVLNDGGGEERFHTTQKPLALMEALIRDFTDAGETVLDPFAGSGTTGAAALRLGRRFVGWERDETYHAKASARLAAVREQGDLFATRGPKPKQGSLVDAPKRGRRAA